MSETDKSPIAYDQTGVRYDIMDPFKIRAQQAAATTARNLKEHFGYKEVVLSRGESAYVWDEGDRYGAKVTEELGTANLVADEVRKITGKTYYDAMGQSTVAAIVNDLIVVGALPKVITAHFSAAESEWFNDTQRVDDLLSGWVRGCNLAGATWGGGETGALKGILQPGAIALSGDVVGEIYPKERLTLGDKLQPGDAIILIGSSGIHANGLHLARSVADELPDGYATRLSDGSMYGEALLAPTPIYVPAVRNLLESDIDVHYMANITGHGWRKLMRADREFTYRINTIPMPQPVFDLIQKTSRNDDEEMYGIFNMGAGFAVFVPMRSVHATIGHINGAGFGALFAGTIEEGPRQVIIEPKDIVFPDDSLKVR